MNPSFKAILYILQEGFHLIVHCYSPHTKLVHALLKVPFFHLDFF